MFSTQDFSVFSVDFRDVWLFGSNLLFGSERLFRFRRVCMHGWPTTPKPHGDMRAHEDNILI